MITSVPRKGVPGTGPSVLMSERAWFSASVRSSAPAAGRARTLRVRSSGSLAPGSPRLTAITRVHQPTAPRTASRAYLNLAGEHRRAQVLLHVRPGQRRARRASPASALAMSRGWRARPGCPASPRSTSDHAGRTSPMASAPCASAAATIAGDRLLDPDVHDLGAVVGQDDVDQRTRSMSRTSPLTVASTMLALAAASPPCSMCGSRYATDGFFITSADWSARTAAASAPSRTAPPTDLHAVQQHVVDDRQRPVRRSSAASRSASSPARSPSMIRRFSRSHSGSAASSAARLALKLGRVPRPRTGRAAGASGS